MNKLTLICLVAFLLLPAASGESLFERSFAEMGYEDFLVEGAQKRGCQPILFLYPDNIDIQGEEIYPIASIGLLLGPVQQGKIDVNVSLNGNRIAALSILDFKCAAKTCCGRKSLCWERLALLKSLLQEEENTLEVCLGTGNSITSILLSGESKVGLHKAADFSGENAFRVQAEKNDLVIGEKTTIRILLHNQGSASTTAKIEFARPLAEDKNAFSVVEGDTYFTGVVKAGEEVEISYVVKPRVAAYMTLPPAIVYYENEFGELESMFSNLVSLNVREPDRKIEAFIVKEEENAFVGQSIEMRLAVKNVGSDPLYDLSVDLVGEVSISQQERGIAAIQPKETRYLPFTVSSPEAGKFPIGCTVTYLDLNVSESHCKDSFVLFALPSIGPEIYAGIALVAIAVAVYIYLMKS